MGTARRRVKASSVHGLTDTLSENVASAVRTANTLNWNEIPEWMKNNEYILTGYRSVQGNWKGCLDSLFSYVHNESVNVHTHLWPALLFLCLLSLTVIPFTSISPLTPYPTTASWDKLHFSIFFASAFICMACSALFHLAGCHSEGTAMACSKLDYGGIITLIVGSFYPPIYYGFACSQITQITYLSCITILGFLTSFVTFAPTFSKPSYRSLRACIFISLGLSGLIPITHLTLHHGPSRLYIEMGFSWLLISGLLYISGALFYANRWPEKWFPGKFDLFFSSHQIFHACVVMAAFAHWACIVGAYTWVHGLGGGNCRSQ